MVVVVVVVGLFWRAQRRMVTRLLRGYQQQHQMLCFFPVIFSCEGRRGIGVSQGRGRGELEGGRRAQEKSSDEIEGSRRQRRSRKRRKWRKKDPCFWRPPANAGAQRNPRIPYSGMEIKISQKSVEEMHEIETARRCLHSLCPLSRTQQDWVAVATRGGSDRGGPAV